MPKIFDAKAESKKQWTADPCGFPEDKSLEVGSEEFYRRIDENRYVEYAPWLTSVVEFDRFADRSVLEVGFGMGTDLFQFAQAGAEVSGIDLSPRHLEIASRRFSLYGMDADLRLADAEEMPFPDDTFDVVYSFGVIHHTPNMQKAIDEIYRVLKPGGRSILAVYHRNSAYFLFLLMLSGYLLRFKFLRESYGRFLSRIEHRSNSDACPLVKLSSRRSLGRMLRKFETVEMTCRHLERFHFGALRRLISPKFARRLESQLGWYLIAKCHK